MQHAIMLLEDSLREEIKPLIEGLGFALVEIRVVKTKGSAIVRVIIFGARGVGIEDCAALARVLHPKLELREDLGDFSLEVSSPGIGRILKSPEEYEIFKGKGVAVLMEGMSEWIKGVIDHASGEKLFLKVKGERMEIPFTEIKRMKLTLVGEEGEKDNVL